VSRTPEVETFRYSPCESNKPGQGEEGCGSAAGCDGVDPAVRRLDEKNAKVDTFADVAAEWLAFQRKRFAPATMEKAEWASRDLINP
jgi:hypothetical protein